MRIHGALALTVAVLAGQALAQQRAVLPKSIVRFDPACHDATRIVVKIAESPRELADATGIRAARVLAAIGDRATTPLFAGLEDELAHIRARQLAACAEGASPPVDLARYHVVAARDAADGKALLASLQALPEVELAYPRELPTPPPMLPGDILPATPDFTAQQAYHAPAPSGIDASAIRGMTGGFGAGVTVLDIEWGWAFDHEDLGVLRPSSLVGPAIAHHDYDAHGLAVIGELAADADASGVTGLVPDVRVRVATDYPASGYSVAAAIVAGLPVLQTGDVIVLEAQTGTPLGTGPTEWNQADFDAIVVATGLGMVVVEAAGNGGVDLDSPTLGRAFDLTFRDSGAIIVGASNAGALTRASFSCRGSRIDANGWGSSVVTTGYGSLFSVAGDARQSYTATFNGTSSATPIVASAVIALLGAARAQWEPARAAQLDAFAIRSLLRAHGTALPSQAIGRRPDAEALFAAALLARGLRVLGTPDVGQSFQVEIAPLAVPDPGDLWALLASASPDIEPLPSPLFAPGELLLLNPLDLTVIASGTFGATAATTAFTVPNDQALRGGRLYVQGLTLDAATFAMATTNSGHLFVRR